MFLVQKEKCDQCLFSDKRIVSKKRAENIIKKCHREDGFFVCHKTQTNEHPQEVCCRGYWDNFKNNFNLGRIAQRLGMIKWITLK